MITAECRQVSNTECRCGETFPGLYMLEVHLFGPAMAEKLFLDRFDALRVIHANGGDSRG